MKIFSPTITGSLGVLGNTILDGDLNVTGNITGSTVYSPSGSFLDLTATSASFGYVQTITGSAVIIGDEFIVLNANTPAARYAGLIVYDSGSGSPATASFEWDGLTDNWIIQEETGNTAVVLTGPTGSRGTEVLPTVNVLQKGGGHHQLVDSSITDNGSNVTFTTPIAGTSISASSGFLGNLTGTASFATSASFAPSTPAFPFTGSARITGSLAVTGSISTNDVINLTGTNKWINSVTTGAYPVGEGLVAIASANPAVNASARYSGVFASTNATIGSNGFMAFVLGGDLNDADGIRTGVIGGYNNNVSVSNSYIFGGSNNDITGGTSEMIVVGGNNFNITGGTTSIGLGGNNNTISGGANNAILAGSGNTNNQNRSVVIGGQNITATAADTVYVPNFVASGSIITGNPSTSTALGARSAVIGGNNNDIAATADNSAIVGGENNVINSGESNAVILGGQSNTMTSVRGAIIASLSSSVLGDSAGVIVGGQSNTTNGGYYQGIVAGQSNTATGIQSFIGGGFTNNVSGNTSATIGGTGNSVTHISSVILGGSSIASRADNTAHAQNLIVTTLTTLSGSLIVSGSSTFLQSTVLSGSIRGEVNALSIASNTASLDCALDNFFTLQLVSGSNTFINPSNILPGQTINLRINTTGSATVSFPSSVKQVSGSAYVPTTTTGVDVVTFISFDSTSLLLSNVKNLV